MWKMVDIDWKKYRPKQETVLSSTFIFLARDPYYDFLISNWQNVASKINVLIKFAFFS